MHVFYYRLNLSREGREFSSTSSLGWTVRSSPCFSPMSIACLAADGLIQEAFAAACKQDRTYIGGVERGERNISLRNILS